MKIQTKWQRILLTIVLGSLTFFILNCIFAYMYYASHGVYYSKSYAPVTFFDALYYALVTFLTIGYGDIIPVSSAAKAVFFAQSFTGLILPPIFSGLLFYFIIKRPKNVFISDHIYIRHRKNKFLLSVRIGNRGASLANVEGILELFHYRGTTRRRTYEYAEDYPLLEERWYFDIKLQDPENQILMREIIKAVTDKTEISLRLTLVGTDIDTGESVVAVRYYHQKDLRFGKEFKRIYEWENGKKVRYKWQNFNQIEPMEHDLIEEFKRLDSSGLTAEEH